ncbi:MAG TPA: LapA family protein [Noviherbaspirillum sp.]|nr:LapA family protein [Noviherbaspirillum sp.]
MKYVFRIVAVLLFLVFFGFALKNTQDVALEFFWGYELRGPLVLLLLGFFVAGAALGILAMLPTVFRHRRDLSQHKQRLAVYEQQQMRRQSTTPPSADSIVNP